MRLALDVAGIEARPVWKPMHLQPVFANQDRVGGAVSAAIFADGLCLPSGSSLQAEELKRIVEVIRGEWPGSID